MALTCCCKLTCGMTCNAGSRMYCRCDFFFIVEGTKEPSLSDACSRGQLLCLALY